MRVNLDLQKKVEEIRAFASSRGIGLPGRVHINCAFLSAALYAGLDSAILDITSPALRKTLAAAKAVMGQDDYCLEYIGVTRQMMK